MRRTVALLLLVPVLAGCTAPQAPVRARAGDFVVLDWVAVDAEGREVENVTGARAVMGQAVPPRVPPGWEANATRPLPPGLTEALRGAAPGASVDTGLLPAAEAYGDWSEARTIRAPRVEELPREVELPGEALEGDAAQWAGHRWQVEVLERNGSRVRVLLQGGPAEGALLELPSYWNEHYQLWRSRLLSLGAMLRVEHLAEVGHDASVGGVRYVVEEAASEVVADGNHPLAGQALRFRATLRDIAFPGSSQHPLAPDALLVALDGTRMNVSDLRGRAVLLDFYATWCVTCKQQAPILARARAEFPELAIVSVTIDPTDTPDRVEAFRAEVLRSTLATWGRELPADWLWAFDPTGEASKGFSVATIPREVLLDADGRIRATSVGLHPWPELEREVRGVLVS